MFVVETFRQQFREFSDPELYEKPVLEFWAAVAGAVVNADRWANLSDYGVSLFVAHHLVLSRRNEEAAAAGGTPGEVKGPLASRSVDSVSNSWNSGAASEEDAGFWNSTSYGQRYIRLARMVGAGGIQL
jgi:hypothetical protein